MPQEAPPIAEAPKAAAKPPAKAVPKAMPAKAVAKRNDKPVAAAKTTQRTVPAETLCGNRTQFAYLYCMQEQCTRAAQRNNTQCAALRRSGELR